MNLELDGFQVESAAPITDREELQVWVADAEVDRNDGEIIPIDSKVEAKELHCEVVPTNQALLQRVGVSEHTN